jgi:hypothetical protein
MTIDFILSITERSIVFIQEMLQLLQALLIENLFKLVYDKIVGH